MVFPEYSDFCCLALDGPHLELRQEHEILPGLIVSSAQDTLSLESHWVQWLGTLQAESFRNSSLFITAFHGHPYSGGSAEVRVSLETRVRLFHNALLLLGCGYNKAMLMVGGHTSAGHIHVGPISSGLTPSFRPSYRKSRRIEMGDLEEAKSILHSLEYIYSHAPNSPYKRIRKGFNVWIRGVEEGYELSEKLHAFVRASEAIIKPTIIMRRRRKRGVNVPGRTLPIKAVSRQIKASFVSRGQTFVGKAQKNERLLAQFYEIRSSIEHIKDIMPKVTQARGIDHAESFQFRALQCEILASEIYKRILTNTTLLESLRSEQKVEGFWSRSESGRAALWGEPIDLDAEGRAKFFSYIPTDF